MYARGSWSRGAVLLISVLLTSCASSPESQDPATVSRTISQAEVDALLLGQGMGMAAPAEINGYPGPRHVLDLKEELNLTPDQRFATSRLVGTTLGQTRALGQRIVDAERRLDADMASGNMTSAQVKARLENIASLRAQLRFTHIDAHLKQKKILTQDQVARYYELRGREVVLPEPAALPEVTEPLTLPPEPAPDVQDEMPLQQPPAADPDSDSAGDAGLVPLPVPVPALSPAPQVLDVTPAPARESAPPLIQEETFIPEAVEEEPFEPEVEAAPVVPAAPAEAPQGLTPGMQDALDEAEPAPVTIEEIPEAMPAQETAPPIEAAPQLPPPSTQEVVTPEEPAEAPALSPGMQDAMEEAEPVLEEEPAAEEAPPLPPPVEEAAAPAEEPAPAKLSPGMQDAMEEAEPVIETAPATPAAPKKEAVAPVAVPVEEPAPEIVSPQVVEEAAPAMPAAPVEEVASPVAVPVEEPAPTTVSPGAQDARDVAEPAIEAAPAPATKTVAPAEMSPGMQDAMELAEPLPAPPPLPVEEEEEAVHIAPLEEEALEELPPVDPQEPVMIDLDN